MSSVKMLTTILYNCPTFMTYSIHGMMGAIFFVIGNILAVSVHYTALIFISYIISK